MGRLSTLLAVVLVACHSGTLPDRPFLAISKLAAGADDLIAPATSPQTGSDAPRAVLGAQAESSFYLAIKKSELQQRWFLSAYLKQVFPYGVAGGAASSLGTRVVSFRVQNDKLFVFSADAIKKTSDTFDPQVLVDAYPLVTDHKAFADAGGYADYVLFDPAAGESSLGFFGEQNAAYGVKFTTELQYMQRYRELEDGITFEMVFSGLSEVADPKSWMAGEPNTFKSSGTLGVGLRRYREGEGFREARAVDRPHYFTSDLRLQPNTGKHDAPPAKWNIRRGGKPIRWVISDQFLKYKQHPDYKDFDVVGAIQAGVTNWNQAFGFEALSVEVATINDSYADDDVNYVVFDADPTYGFAFANWRTNPNTGEIRGASVYFNASWITGAVKMFEDDKPEAPTPSNARPMVGWGGMVEQRLCTLTLERSEREGPAGLHSETARMLTKKQKVEAYLTHVMVHEIGHTLGLRHNFKGSLQAPSSSVMDYLSDDDSFATTYPGSYDVAAVRFLYDLSNELPSEPFCTDEHTRSDPDCNRFDTGADPLQDGYLPWYRTVLTSYLAGTSPTAPNSSLNSVLQYVRAAQDPDTAELALNAALDGLRVHKVPAPGPANPGTEATTADYYVRVDRMHHRVLQRLYLDPADARGAFRTDPSRDITLALLPELEATLLNADGLRSFATRRAVVDILKKVQMGQAAAVLGAGEAHAAAEVTAASDAVRRAEATDLLKRIQEANTPYFHSTN